jgi:hypothetical protein
MIVAIGLNVQPTRRAKTHHFANPITPSLTIFLVRLRERFVARFLGSARMKSRSPTAYMREKLSLLLEFATSTELKLGLSCKLWCVPGANTRPAGQRRPEKAIIYPPLQRVERHVAAGVAHAKFDSYSCKSSLLRRPSCEQLP